MIADSSTVAQNKVRRIFAVALGNGYTPDAEASADKMTRYMSRSEAGLATIARMTPGDPSLRKGPPRLGVRRHHPDSAAGAGTVTAADTFEYAWQAIRAYDTMLQLADDADDADAWDVELAALTRFLIERTLYKRAGPRRHADGHLVWTGLKGIGSSGNVPVSIDYLARQLRMAAKVVEDRLDVLVGMGLVEVTRTGDKLRIVTDSLLEQLVPYAAGIV
jgi:hypothetical protein